MAKHIPTKAYIAYAGHDYDGNIRLTTACVPVVAGIGNQALRIAEKPAEWMRIPLPELHPSYEGYPQQTVVVGAFAGYTLSSSLLPKLRQTVLDAALSHYEAVAANARAMVAALELQKDPK